MRVRAVSAALDADGSCAGLGPGIHDCSPAAEVVDGRPKAGHDGERVEIQAKSEAGSGICTAAPALLSRPDDL